MVHFIWLILTKKPMARMLLLFGLLILMVAGTESIGVCNGRVGDGLPCEQEVVTLYQNNGISQMRIYDPNQATLEALGATGIELMIGVPNDALQSLTDQNAANAWVQANILVYPNVNFKYIAVGNEVDPDTVNGPFVDFVLPAMQNVYNSIRDVGLDNLIKVSTVTYGGLLGTSFPPSSGAFKENVKGFIEPIIGFLAQNNLPMLANIYPYFGYLDDTNSDLSYALFTAQGPVVSDPNGLQYYNLFDAMLDTCYAALARLGGENVEIVVSESGWPSEGDREATVENAGIYYQNLIKHIRAAIGTPLKPGIPIETYLFAMFDENQKDGKESEKHFGIFHPDQQPKYGISNFN